MTLEKAQSYIEIVKQQDLGETVKFFLKELRRIPMPRSAMAILGALVLEFPEYFSERQLRTDVKKLGHLMPVLIACNDYCDIAIASLDVSPATHMQATELVVLERKLWQGFYRQNESFFSEYPEERERLESAFRAYFAESIVLSQNRQEPDVTELLSLDSLLFESFCIEVLIPELNRDLGLGYSRQVSSYSDLKAKYERLLVEDGEVSHLTDVERRMVILHITEMLLKLSDDEIGKDIDRILHAPNFVLAKEQDPSNPSLDEVRTMYLALLRKLDGNIFIARLGDILFTINQKVKFFFRYGRRDFPIFELHELGKLLAGERGDLREKLMESSILPDLFRRKIEQ